MNRFSQIWAVDFEFIADPGERPLPICLVARELLSGRLIRCWRDQLGVNARSLRNFPMQANGAEMLRLACCLAGERGVTVCAPVHDAILIEAPEAGLEGAVATTRQAMAEASRTVLDAFELATEVKVIRWPGRHADPRGEVMWRRVQAIMARIEAEPWPASAA